MKKICLVLAVFLLCALLAGAAGAEKDARRMILVTYFTQLGWTDTITIGCVDDDGNLWTMESVYTELQWPASPEEQLVFLAEAKNLEKAGRIDGDDLFDLKGLVNCAEDRGRDTEYVADDAGIEFSYAAQYDSDGLTGIVLLGASGDECFENTDPNAQALYLWLRKTFPDIPSYAYDDSGMGPKGFQPVPVIEFLKMQDLDLTGATVTCYAVDCEAGLIESEVSDEDREWILDLLKNGTVTGKANATMVTGGTWVYIINDAEGNDIGSVELYRGLLVMNDGMYSFSR